VDWRWRRREPPTRLLDGRVLITGGYDDQAYLTGTAALVSP
jgi:hypothetical protein